MISCQYFAVHGLQMHILAGAGVKVVQETLVNNLMHITHINDKSF